MRAGWGGGESWGVLRPAGPSSSLRRMSRWQLGALLAGLLMVGWCGCSRPAENTTDEQNSPHFRAGKEKLSALDYKGALQSFERAVESNPRSALAHFELALLYEQRENDYAAALYHYQKALKLRPNAYPADNARQRIPGCMQELIKADSLALINPTALRETERLREENANLRRQLQALQGQPGGTPSNAVANVRPGTSTAPRPPETAQARTGMKPNPAPSPVANPAAPAARGRTHSIQSGETAASIARLHRVRLDALLAANPGLDVRRLRVGQSVNIPGP